MRKWLCVFFLLAVCVLAVAQTQAKTVTILFGGSGAPEGACNFKQKSLSYTDADGMPWQMEAKGTPAFDSYPTYCKVGTDDHPARAVTMTGTASATMLVKSVQVVVEGASEKAKCVVFVVVDGDTCATQTLSGKGTVVTVGADIEGGTCLEKGDNIAIHIAGNGTTTITGGVKIYSITYTYVPVLIEKVVVSGEPAKKSYVVGEAFDIEGLQATAIYTDGVAKDVTSVVNWFVTPEVFENAGENMPVQIWVEYSGADAAGVLRSDVYAVEGIFVRAKEIYIVRWMVDGKVYSEDEVNEGGSIESLPTPPVDYMLACCDVFAGWSSTNVGAGTGNERPADLFTSAEDAPEVVTDMTFYAVFATSTMIDRDLVRFDEGGIGTLSQIEGIKCTGLEKSERIPYYVTFDETGDNIVWENSAKDYVETVSFRIKKVGGTSIPSMAVQVSDDGINYRDMAICEINGPMDTVLLFDVPVASSPGYIRLYFTKTCNVAFGDFFIRGSGVRYSDYRTACAGTPTEIERKAEYDAVHSVLKTLENGLVVIVRDGMAYDLLGRKKHLLD